MFKRTATHRRPRRVSAETRQFAWAAALCAAVQGAVLLVVLGPEGTQQAAGVMVRTVLDWLV